MTISSRTPEGVLSFWLGGMRSVGDASRDNWRDRMLMWRLGPFARSAENKEFFDAQRDWCEQIHKEGVDAFFSDPAWETPKGVLAKLIVLDQFPRSVYRGTPVAYANDSVTVRMAEHLCTTAWDMTEFNILERMWVYVPLSHAEELALQELCVDKYVRWSKDLAGVVASGRRRINQFISWSFIKASIEHSDALLVFGRFPHRNAILGREHKAGEPRYLNDPVRPLWTFTQPPRPDYFAVLGALCRFRKGLDEDRIGPEPLAELHRAAKLPLDGPDSLMDVLDLGHNHSVAYTTFYRHMRLREKERAFDAVRRVPLVADLFDQIRQLILKDPAEPWPPRSAKYSVKAVIDVAALKAIVADALPPVAPSRRPTELAVTDPEKALSLMLKNDSAELGRLAQQVEEFAGRHAFPYEARFQLQLALEEWVMNTINYGYNDAAEHEIEVDLQFHEETRTLVVHIVDDAREYDPLADNLEPDFEAFLADRVEGSGIGIQLVLKFADDIGYRREDGFNHLTLTKTV